MVVIQRRTKATTKLLTVLDADPDSEHYGLDLMRRAGLRSGTLYPILYRLEADGWLEARWEERDEPGPRRRLYRLTAKGRTEIAALVHDSPS